MVFHQGFVLPHNPEVVGSNPSPATIKEASFVYQGKRGFLVVLYI